MLICPDVWIRWNSPGDTYPHKPPQPFFHAQSMSYSCDLKQAPQHFPQSVTGHRRLIIDPLQATLWTNQWQQHQTMTNIKTLCLLIGSKPWLRLFLNPTDISRRRGDSEQSSDLIIHSKFYFLCWWASHHFNMTGPWALEKRILLCRGMSLNGIRSSYWQPVQRQFLSDCKLITGPSFHVSLWIKGYHPLACCANINNAVSICLPKVSRLLFVA